MPLKTLASWVDTSAVLPVTPVSVAMTPDSSVCVTFIFSASGTTRPRLAANSGNDVCPNRTTVNMRSLAC